MQTLQAAPTPTPNGTERTGLRKAVISTINQKTSISFGLLLAIIGGSGTLIGVLLTAVFGYGQMTKTDEVQANAINKLEQSHKDAIATLTKTISDGFEKLSARISENEKDIIVLETEKRILKENIRAFMQSSKNQDN